MNPVSSSADPLAALRPLHEPVPVSWWPPAPGWWILAAILLACMVWLVWWYLRGRIRRAALRELDELLNNSDLSDREFAAGVSALLKRYALHSCPGQEVASLTGKKWLEFLDAAAGRGQFVSGPGKVLASCAYSSDCRVDRQALGSLCRQWIKKVRCSTRQRGQA